MAVLGSRGGWCGNQEQRTDEDRQHSGFLPLEIQTWPHRYVFEGMCIDVQSLARLFSDRLCALVLHFGYQRGRCRWNVVFFHNTFDLE